MLLQTVFALDGVDCSVKTSFNENFAPDSFCNKDLYTCSVIIFLVIRLLDDGDRRERFLRYFIYRILGYVPSYPLSCFHSIDSSSRFLEKGL